MQSEAEQESLTFSARSMSVVGEYDVGRTLGVGATGRVRLGRHRQTGQLVALKMVPRNVLVYGGQVSQAVRREIAVLHLIAYGNSPADGVLTLYDVISTEEFTVLALEYCPGGDLFELLLNHGRLPLPYVRDYFLELAKALHICHKRGICHRDLKPENILISADGKLKIADFGMSGLLSPTSLLETSCGSPHYCAPEVLSGQRYSGSEADIWSLGVILFAMITGGLPFDDDNLHRLTRKVCDGRFHMPSEVPEDIANLIRSMLAVVPSHRISLEDVLRSEWLGGDAIPDVADEISSSANFAPVTAPDARIISFLADLGLGNDYMLRRRLSGKRDCLERRMYYRFAAVMFNEQVALVKAPEVALTPTSVTACICFEAESSQERANLEQSLERMRLSEAYKEVPRGIPGKTLDVNSAQSMGTRPMMQARHTQSVACAEVLRAVSSISAEPLCTTSDIEFDIDSPRLQRMKSEGSNDCTAVARARVSNAVGLGNTAAVETPLSGATPLASQMPSWPDIVQGSGTCFPIPQG